MAQNVECRLPFLKLLGEQPLFVQRLHRHHLFFFEEKDQEYGVMTRARMPITRVCIYHIDNVEAGKSHAFTGECLAHMMYERMVHQVTVVGRDANKMAYQRQGQQLNASYGMSTLQFWLDRMELTMDRYW